jgi:hypothetical protein
VLLIVIRFRESTSYASRSVGRRYRWDRSLTRGRTTEMGERTQLQTRRGRRVRSWSSGRFVHLGGRSAAVGERGEHGLSVSRGSR